MQPFQLATMNSWDDVLLGANNNNNNNNSDSTQPESTSYRQHDQKQSYKST